MKESGSSESEAGGMRMAEGGGRRADCAAPKERGAGELLTLLTLITLERAPRLTLDEPSNRRLA